MIVKIDKIALTYPLHVEEENSSNLISSKSLQSIDGGLIVFEQINRVSSQNLTLKSLDSGWQDKKVVSSLIEFANSSLGVYFNIQNEKGVKTKVRFRHEDGAINFEPLYEGANFYKGTINLARVEE